MINLMCCSCVFCNPFVFNLLYWFRLYGIFCNFFFLHEVCFYIWWCGKAGPISHGLDFQATRTHQLCQKFSTDWILVASWSHARFRILQLSNAFCGLRWADFMLCNLSASLGHLRKKMLRKDWVKDCLPHIWPWVHSGFWTGLRWSCCWNWYCPNLSSILMFIRWMNPCSDTF